MGWKGEKNGSSGGRYSLPKEASGLLVFSPLAPFRVIVPGDLTHTSAVVYIRRIVLRSLGAEQVMEGFSQRYRASTACLSGSIPVCLSH